MSRSRIPKNSLIIMFSFLICLPPLDAGATKGRRRYFRSRSTRDFQMVMDSPYQMWSNSGTKVHVVVFTPRFRPVKDAKIYRGNKYLGKTDRNGTFIFNFRSGLGKAGGAIIARKTIRGVPYHREITFNAYRRTSSFGKARIYLYTDRLTYRPGEKLKARLIAWSLKDAYTPVTGRFASITLLGPQGAVRSKKVRLSAFGTAHATLDLAGLPPYGYRLVAEVGKGRHQRLIRLAHFKRPALEINHTFSNFMTPRTATLTATIRLSDLRGRSPSGGKMTVEAMAAGKVRVRREFKLTGSKSYTVTFNDQELKTITGALNVQQKARIRVNVRQKTGATSTLNHYIRYVYNPYRAVIETDKDAYQAGQKVTALVKLTDLDQRPVKGKRVALTIGERGRKRWAKTDKNGVATFKFKAPRKTREGYVELFAYVRDVKDDLATAQFDITAAGSMDSKLAVPQVKQGRWVPISVTLRSGFRPRERVLHCDITDYSGAIVSAFTIPFRRSGGRWVARGRFKAPSWGTMLLTMFAIGSRGRGKVGLMTAGQQITVHPNRALKLTLSGVPEQAKPGSRLSFKLRVTNAAGRPTDASVGAVLVDRNVLALGDPLKRLDPKEYLYNPQLKVMATTGSKILTWPVVTRTWGCEREDIALPPFPFMKGGGCRRRYRRAMALSGSGSVKKKFAFDMAPTAARPMPRARPAARRTSSPKYFLMSRARRRIMKRKTFRIRKQFAATAWWAPALLARNGALKQGFALPDGISRQQLILVASDKAGGVGVVQKTVTVTQKVSVELDLPPRMVESDVLSFTALFRNNTGKPLSLTVTTGTKRLTVLKAPRKLAVPAGRTVSAVLRVKADKPGKGSIKLIAHHGNEGDALIRKIRVLPSGPPIVTTRKGTLSRTHTLRWTVNRRRTDKHLTAHLMLDFPNAMPALMSVQKMVFHPSLGGDSSASVLSAVALLLRYWKPYKLSHPFRNQLKQFLRAGAQWLLAHMHPSGGYAYWRLRKLDPYHTAYVLETLLDIKAAGIAVRAQRLRQMAWYLLTHRNAQGLWNVRHLAFWEGHRRDIRTGLSAEIFRAVARASNLKCIYQPSRHLVSVARKMERLASRESRDPRTIAAALSGLLALHTRCKPARKLSASRRKQFVGMAKRLLRLKRNRYWEPSWFSAYGGTLEATATALVTLFRLDRARYRAELREGLRYLASRKAGWGEWHNERGTAATIRALIEIGAESVGEMEGAAVSVNVNGKTVRAVYINPKDPYGSAINLRHLLLDPYLKAGANRITVNYTGALKVGSRLVVKRWTSARHRPRPPAGKLRARLIAPRSAAIGRVVSITLVATGNGKRGAAVTVGLPSTVKLARGEIKRLTVRGKVLKAQLSGRNLTVHLPPFRRSTRVTVRFVPTVRGTSAFTAPAAAPLRAGSVQPGSGRIPFISR